MKIEQIRQVVEIHRAGSINKASENLFLSQPAVSHSLKSLEKELNREIFVRSHSGIEPTEFGKTFINHAIELLKHADQIEYAARDRYCGNAPLTFRVSVYYLLFAWNAFTGLIGRYRDNATNFHYNQVCLSNVFQDIKRDASELGLISIPTIDKKKWLAYFELEDMSYTPIYRGAPNVMLSVSHPLFHSGKPSLSPGDLRDYPLVVIGEPMDLFSQMNRKMGEALKAPAVIEASDRTTAHDYISAIGGYCCVIRTGTAYTKMDFFSDMKLLPIDGLPFEFELGWIKKQDRVLSSVALEYMEDIAALLGPCGSIQPENVLQRETEQTNK